jgi:hypothetical protein
MQKAWPAQKQGAIGTVPLSYGASPPLARTRDTRFHSSQRRERATSSGSYFVGRSADKATAEDVRRYQLWLASSRATVPTVNAGACSLRFFFAVTLKRRDLADAVVSVREPLPPPHCSQPARGRSPAPIDDEHQARAA